MMKRTLILILLITLSAKPIFACSACAITKGKHLVVGKNLDWFCDLAMLVVNKRGIKKTALQKVNPVQWVSKYGSVTINPNGVGIPCGGMNEAGLVIEESWLNETEYPSKDQRPAIDEIQWIQYQLDNCKSVDEVIASDKKVRISAFYGKSHYFIYDRNGNALTVDFVAGKTLFNKVSKKGVQVLTNDTYTNSLQKLKQHQGFGGTEPIRSSPDSYDRFCKAADMVAKFDPGIHKNPVNYAFDILKEISQPATSWSIVYDVKNLTVNFRTARFPMIKQVRFRDFDFSSKTPPMLMDINTERAGNIGGFFEAYTAEKNKSMVLKAVKSWRDNNFATHITDADVIRICEYPETMRAVH